MPTIPVLSSLPLLLRSCGDCSACCTPLGIDNDGLRKPPGVPCHHLGPAGRGCTIYATRPTHCQRYLCGWRNGIGEDAHRPDRLGILLSACMVRAELVTSLRLPATAFLCHSTHAGDLSRAATEYLEAVAVQYIVIGVEHETARWAVGPELALTRAMTLCRALGHPITAILDLSVNP